MSFSEAGFRCAQELQPSIDLATAQHDVRVVIAALLSQVGALSQAAISIGIEKKFIEEMFAGAFAAALEPAKKKPAVAYLDSETGEILGRKQ